MIATLHGASGGGEGYYGDTGAGGYGNTLGGGANNGGWLSIAARDRLGIGTAVYNNINDSWFDGHIAMIAFGGSPLTADERSVVYDIINYKYGV